MFWRRLVRIRRFGLRVVNRRKHRRAYQANIGKELALTVLVALFMAAALVFALELRARPLAEELARTQLQNEMTGRMERALLYELSARQLDYRSFVSVERSEGGGITAITANIAELNRLRANLLSDVLASLEEDGVLTIEIPMGSLVDLDFLWARGPSLRLHAISAGTVSAEYESEFTSAGVNQTLHRILLDIQIPLRLMLPGGYVDTSADTRLCVAETVIVGTVPETYLQVTG